MSQTVTTPDGVEHEFPDGATPEQMRAALSRYAPTTTMTATETPVTGRLRSMSGQLPNILGGIGSLVPGPWGYGLAAAGGGVGEAGREMIQGQPLDPRAIAGAGAAQGGLSLAGGLAAKPVMSLAKATMRGALRASGAERLMGRFPDVVETMLKERVPGGQPTRRTFGLPGGRTGEEVATAKLGEATALRDAMLDRAEQAGKVVNRAGALKYVERLIAKTAKSRIKNPEKMAVLNQEMEMFLRDNPQLQWTPNEAKALLKSAQEEAAAAFETRATETGALRGSSNLVKKFYEELSRGTRKELHRAVPKMGGKTFTQAETRVQSLIGAKQGARRIERLTRKGAPAQVPLLPAWAQGLIPAAVRSPNAFSRMALFMSDPTLLQIVRQQPRLAAALLFSEPAPPDTLPPPGY